MAEFFSQVLFVASSQGAQPRPLGARPAVSSRTSALSVFSPALKAGVKSASSTPPAALGAERSAPGAAMSRDSAGGAGYVLFVTPVGICALAWTPRGIVAAQLPEMPLVPVAPAASGGAAVFAVGATSKQASADNAAPAMATAQRMLKALMLRRPGHYAQVVDAAQLPPDVVLAADGITAMLSGQMERQAELDALELDWVGVSHFQQQVYALTRAIAPGQTRSYGELARELGRVGLARAVGQALGANPFAPVIPCHRVLGATGLAVGFSAGGGTASKLHMLQLEGVKLGQTLPLFDF